MTVKCGVCNKHRNSLATRINFEDRKNPYVECIECASGIIGCEDEFLKTQQIFFDSTDKIHKQMDSIIGK